MSKQITEVKINSIKFKVTGIFLIIANLEGKYEQVEKELKDERQKPNNSTTPISQYVNVTRREESDKHKNINKTKQIILVTPKKGEDTRKIEGKIKQIWTLEKKKLTSKPLKQLRERKDDADKILGN